MPQTYLISEQTVFKLIWSIPFPLFDSAFTRLMRVTEKYLNPWTSSFFSTLQRVTYLKKIRKLLRCQSPLLLLQYTSLLPATLVPLSNSYPSVLQALILRQLQHRRSLASRSPRGRSHLRHTRDDAPPWRLSPIRSISSHDKQSHCSMLPPTYYNILRNTLSQRNISFHCSDKKA